MVSAKYILSLWGLEQEVCRDCVFMILVSNGRPLCSLFKHYTTLNRRACKHFLKKCRRTD